MTQRRAYALHVVFWNLIPQYGHADHWFWDMIKNSKYSL